MPAYEAAVKALKSLDKKAIQELKAFANPPEMVKFTLEAVLILFELKPDWGEAKKLMSNMDFMEQLANYDKDNIPKKVINKVRSPRIADTFHSSSCFYFAVVSVRSFSPPLTSSINKHPLLSFAPSLFFHR